MRKTIFKHTGRCGFVSLGLVAIFLGALTNGAAGGAFTRGCAARDLQILMLIEERETSDTVAADALSDAMLALLEARIVCHQGRVVDAMALYDGIASSVTPDACVLARPMGGTASTRH
jgi:hypothetical protein